MVDLLLADRPLDRLRSVQAILRLVESVGRERVEAACARALHFGDPRYRRIKDILNAALDRLTHHAHTLVIRGQSYRQRERRKERAESAQTPPDAAIEGELQGQPPPLLAGGRQAVTRDFRRCPTLVRVAYTQAKNGGLDRAVIDT